MPRTGENIYKRKDGRWEGRYIKNHINGKAKYGYVYGKTYKDAKNKLIKAQNICDTQIISTGFNYWLNEWLALSQKRVKESTYIKYLNSVDNHIRPFLGKKKIEDISTAMLEEFIDFQMKYGNLRTGKQLSLKTTNEILIILKEVISFARSEGVSVKCQLNRISIKTTKPQMRVLSKSEEQKLIRELISNTDRYKMGVLLCLCTGIRIGELCALTWDDISFSEKTLKVSATLQRLQTKKLNNSDTVSKTQIVISEPKTEASNRIIPLQEELCQIMLPFKMNNHNFILSNSNNKFVEPRVMHNKFKAYIKQCEILNANFHSLRHTFATRCVESGCDAKTLSEILGHTSVRTTLDRYVHSSMQQKRNVINKSLLKNIYSPSLFMVDSNFGQI